MNFILHRDRTIASLSGRSVEFKKGVPTFVPPQMHADVIAAGAIPEDELDEPDVKKPSAPQGEERVALIKLAMAEIVTDNIREQFTAGGAPHAKALTARLGFEVNPKERDAIWTALQQEGK